MTTNDIDAIRSILAALDGRSLDKRPALAGRLAANALALCDEIEQLRAARDNLAAYNRVVKKANDDLCAELARVDTALDDAVSQIRELHIERDALRADQRARTQETTR